MDGDDGGAALLLCCRISHSVQDWDNGETRNPLCLVAASEYRATRELVESSWMATMGGAAWLPCCRISHYLQSWDNGWTRNPLCLVGASEYRASRELVESSWMATMGVLHGYDVAHYTASHKAKSRDRARPYSPPPLLGSYSTVNASPPESW